MLLAAHLVVVALDALTNLALYARMVRDTPGAWDAHGLVAPDLLALALALATFAALAGVRALATR